MAACLKLENGSLSDSDASLSASCVSLGTREHDSFLKKSLEEAVATHRYLPLVNLLVSTSQKIRPTGRIGIEEQQQASKSILALRTVDPLIPYDIVRQPDSAYNKARRVLLPKGLEPS